MQKLLTTKEVAEYLGLTTAKLEAWRCENRGPRFIRLGYGRKSAIRYKPEDLDAWVEERLEVTEGTA